MRNLQGGGEYEEAVLVILRLDGGLVGRYQNGDQLRITSPRRHVSQLAETTVREQAFPRYKGTKCHAGAGAETTLKKAGSLNQKHSRLDVAGWRFGV